MSAAKPSLFAPPSAALAGLGRIVFVAFLALVLAVGCQKKTPEAVMANDEGIEPADPQVESNLANLSGLLRRTMRQHRLTTNFDDFVAAANVDVPPPPPGQKYAINKKWKVVLVDAIPK